MNTREYINSLIIENLGLVKFSMNKLNLSGKDIEELEAIGRIGLVKAANSYDQTKSKFSTYAIICIRNEIFKSFRSSNKHLGVLSLDEDINDGDSLVIGDTIKSDEEDIIDLVIYKELLDKLSKEIHALPPRDQEIVTRLYGLDGKTRDSQSTISNDIGITQASVSRANTKILKKLQRVLEA